MADAVVDQKPEASPGPAEAESKKPDGDYWQSEAKKAFKERDEARAKAKAFEDAQNELRKKQLEESGKFKEEWEKTLPELETLRTFKKTVEEKTQAKLAESEKSLTSEHREEYDKYIVKLSTDERIEWIENRLGKAKPVPSSPASGRPQGSISKTRDEINQLSPDERIALYRKDPEGFQKLMNG